MIRYVCKYTPLELFAGFHESHALLDHVPGDHSVSEQIIHPNLCGYGKAVLDSVLTSPVEALFLVNCCDVMRRVYDEIKRSGACQFLFLMDLPHLCEGCGIELLADELLRLKDALAAYLGKSFHKQAFLSAFTQPEIIKGPTIGLCGVRFEKPLKDAIQSRLPLPVRDLTCTEMRQVPPISDTENENDLFLRYAEALLSQFPCRRMGDLVKRRQLYDDPNLAGVIFHSIKFCDFSGFEYAEQKKFLSVPILRLETDYTRQNEGQLISRIEAFAETIASAKTGRDKDPVPEKTSFAAGIDSGSATTSVVILDAKKNIVSSVVMKTGSSAQQSAQACLAEALNRAGLKKDQLGRIVRTGYGRSFINIHGETVTEITCHAVGAHFLDPNARTVIDIGGQDLKVIRIDKNGTVQNFVMNDKCAAGTGRFLEMMARTLNLTDEEMSKMGLNWKEEITISSMCTVFAESEVVSLIAQNKAVEDIIHGLNKAVASKIAALAGRLGHEEGYILTGGVAKNEGVARAIEEKLHVKLTICDEAQICGALGAALIALRASD